MCRRHLGPDSMGSRGRNCLGWNLDSFASQVTLNQISLNANVLVSEQRCPPSQLGGCPSSLIHSANFSGEPPVSQALSVG